MPSPRHPGVASALTRDEVACGVPYVTFIPGDKVIERGTFVSAPDYDEGDNRWNALAKVQAGTSQIIERTVCLFDAGITPDQDGESWSEAVTITDAE